MRNNTIADRTIARCAMAALLGTSSLASHAACTQADVKGVWLVSGLSTVTYDAPNHEQASFTTFCKLAVNSAGAFSKASSTCNSSLGPTAVEGALKISGKTCSVKPFTMKVFSGGVQAFTFTVDYMALDKLKTAFTATGNKDSANTGMAQFIWQGVKQ